MILTLVAFWAIVLPVVIVGGSWHAARVREARSSQTAQHSVPRLVSPAGPLPARARGARPRRTITRRACPESARSAGHRSASA